MAAPWLYVRAKLAEAWHCRPAEIDEDADADEIGIQLEIWDIQEREGPKPGG